MTDTNPLLMALRMFAGNVINYFVVVGLLYLVVWKWGASRFRKAKLRAAAIDAAQFKHEIKHTLMSLSVGLLNGAAVMALYQSGHTRLSADLPLWYSVLSAVFLVAFNDTWFYWCHRLLHHPKIFKAIHAVHHRSVTVNPFSSYSFHAAEGLIMGGWVIPMVLLVPLSPVTIGIMQVVGLGNNVMSHLGHEFFPRWLMKIPLLRNINTATFHHLHHTGFNGNYGLFSRFWDKVCGTELPAYEATFVQRGSATETTPDAVSAPA